MFKSLKKYIFQFWLFTFSHFIESSFILYCKGGYSHEEVELLPRMTALGNNQSLHRTLNMPVRIKAKVNNILYIYGPRCDKSYLYDIYDVLGKTRLNWSHFFNREVFYCLVKKAFCGIFVIFRITQWMKNFVCSWL